VRMHMVAYLMLDLLPASYCVQEASIDITRTISLVGADIVAGCLVLLRSLYCRSLRKRSST
jgi:hypothetical protein